MRPGWLIVASVFVAGFLLGFAASVLFADSGLSELYERLGLGGLLGRLGIILLVLSVSAVYAVWTISALIPFTRLSADTEGAGWCGTRSRKVARRVPVATGVDHTHGSTCD